MMEKFGRQNRTGMKGRKGWFAGAQLGDTGALDNNS